MDILSYEGKDLLHKWIQKRIAHAERRVEQLKQAQGTEPSRNFTYYGGQSLGYWQGMLNAYDNILGQLEK